MTIDTRYRQYVGQILKRDEEIVLKKDEEYGGSWLRRGGTGAFHAMFRKADRLEEQCRRHGYDVFAACEDKTSSEALLDTIGDLRRYLVLIEAEVTARGKRLAKVLDPQSQSDSKSESDAVCDGSYVDFQGADRRCSSSEGCALRGCPRQAVANTSVQGRALIQKVGMTSGTAEDKCSTCGSARKYHLASLGVTHEFSEPLANDVCECGAARRDHIHSLPGGHAFVHAKSARFAVSAPREQISEETQPGKHAIEEASRARDVCECGAERGQHPVHGEDGSFLCSSYRAPIASLRRCCERDTDGDGNCDRHPPTQKHPGRLPDHES